MSSDPTISDDITEYGNHLRSEFHLALELTQLNHGSFGVVPREVMKHQIQVLEEQESHPDRWFRGIYFKYVEESRRTLANLINAKNVDDVVLVENASSAVNSVLRSMRFNAGDKILVLSTSYQMVLDTLQWLVGEFQVEIIQAVLDYPINSDRDIIQPFQECISQLPFGNVKLAIFSHITSMPAMIEPVKELTSICKVKGCKYVLIDGAHAPGHVPIDVEDIGCDFYTGNCHKWLYAPKGAAFMWIRNEHQSSSFPQPTVISSSKKYDFIGRFEYTGTRDYTAFSSINEGINFQKKHGGYEKIYSYCHKLIVDAGQRLSATWGTYLLVNNPDMIGFMINIVLPTNDGDIAAKVQSELDLEYNIYIVIASVRLKNGETVYFTRLSSQIYLEMEDYLKIEYLVPNLIQKYQQ